MPKRKLTARIHMLTVRHVMAAGSGDHNDGGGLLLRAQGNRISWVFRYSGLGGRRREMGLGTCQRQNAQMAGESLRQARDKAAKARAMLEEQPPRDPIDDRARLLAQAVEIEVRAKAKRQVRPETLARVARRYHERFIEPKLSFAQSARWIGALELHVPGDIWNKPMAEITRTELLDFLLDIQSQFADTAQRVRRRLDEIYDDATDRGIVPDNTVALLREKLRRRNVSHRVTPRPSLAFTKVSEFVKQLRGEEGIAARCLEFVILTAARTGEAIGASWSEINLEGGLWTIPGERMKGGEAHAVYLAPRAIAILEQMQENASPWLFPSPRSREQPLSNMAMLTLLRRMKRTDFVVHGFRASF